jgi:hypothetical protein
MDTVTIADGIPQNPKYVVDFDFKLYGKMFVLVKKDLNNWLKNLKQTIMEFNHNLFVEHQDELILLVILIEIFLYFNKNSIFKR